MINNNLLENFSTHVLRIAREGLPGLAYRPHQSEMLYAFGNHYLEDPKRNGGRSLIRACTGSGKTAAIAGIVKAATTSGLRVLVVFPTKTLVKQTARKFADYDPELAQQCALWYGDRKEDLAAPVVFSTYQSAVAHNSPVDYGAFDLVILDEAHRSLSQKRMSLVEACQDLLPVLALSATTRFDDRRDLRQTFGEPIYDLDIVEGIQRGICSPLQLAEVHVNVENFDLGKFFGTLAETGEQAALLKRPGLIRAAVDIDLGHGLPPEQAAGVHPSDKSIFYCIDVDHAIEAAGFMVSQLDSLGISDAATRCAVVSSRMTKRETDDVLARIESGEIWKIFNADMLIEGFDDINIVRGHNLRPTQSPVLAEQRLGRVARLNNGISVKTIYDYIYGAAEADILDTRQILASDILGAGYLEASRIAFAAGNHEPSTARYPDAGRVPGQLDITVQPHEIEVVTDIQRLQQFQRQRAENARREAETLNGWIGFRALRAILETGTQKLQHRLEEIRPELPEWVCRTYNGKHYYNPDPQAVEHIREKVFADRNRLPMSDIPDSWVSVTELYRFTGISKTFLSRAVEAYKPQLPSIVFAYGRKAGTQAGDHGYYVDPHNPESMAFVQDMVDYFLRQNGYCPKNWDTVPKTFQHPSALGCSKEQFQQLYSTRKDSLPREIVDRFKLLRGAGGWVPCINQNPQALAFLKEWIDCVQKRKPLPQLSPAFADQLRQEMQPDSPFSALQMAKTCMVSGQGR